MLIHIRSLFESYDHYVDHYNTYSKPFFNTSSNSYTLHHYYVVVYKSDCETHCHEYMGKYFINLDNRYSIIDKNNALIYTTAEYLHQITTRITSDTNINNNANGHNSDLSDMIIGYTPLIPHAKINNDLLNMCQTTTNQMIKKRDIGRSFRLRLIIASLDHTQINAFRITINRLHKDHVTANNNLHTNPYLHTNQITYTYRDDSLDWSVGRRQAINLQLHAPDGGILTEDSYYCSHIQTLIHTLSLHPEVQYIERDYDKINFNRWVKGVCQSGVYNNANLYTQSAGNLTGVGEVVGVADTGIDLSSCYFHDPNHATPYNTLNTNHRKVCLYVYVCIMYVCIIYVCLYYSYDIHA